MNFEAPQSQESMKDRLIKSGIAKVAFDSLYSKYPTLLEDMGMTIGDIDFRAAYASEEKDPEVTIEMPNIDPKTKDRAPKVKAFVSYKSVPNFTESLNKEQRRILVDLCEKVGVVVEEPDDLTKERLEKIKTGQSLT